MDPARAGGPVVPTRGGERQTRKRPHRQGCEGRGGGGGGHGRRRRRCRRAWRSRRLGGRDRWPWLRRSGSRPFVSGTADPRHAVALRVGTLLPVFAPRAFIDREILDHVLESSEVTLHRALEHPVRSAESLDRVARLPLEEHAQERAGSFDRLEGHNAEHILTAEPVPLDHPVALHARDPGIPHLPPPFDRRLTPHASVRERLDPLHTGHETRQLFEARPFVEHPADGHTDRDLMFDAVHGDPLSWSSVVLTRRFGPRTHRQGRYTPRDPSGSSNVTRTRSPGLADCSFA